MKFAAIRDLQIKASDVVKDSQREPVVITVHGKPRAVLTSITEGALEDFLFEHSPKLRQRIQAGLRDAKAGRVIAHDDLKSRLKFKLRRTRRAVR
jgi:prevent-host-death family protein